MKKLGIIICASFTLFLLSCKAQVLTPEQQEVKDQRIARIELPDFSFTPSTAQPISGRPINLDNSYFLRITQDTIEAYLPYFGRLYNAPSDLIDLGIKFISTKFDYISTVKKNGIYQISIKPKDITKIDLQDLILDLTISDSGYGTLNVQSANRQNISYYGSMD